MRLVIVAMTLLALASCSSIDRKLDSSFKPNSDGTFEYMAAANMFYPLTSPGAEETRMEWLQQYLDDNGLCRQGYEIANRQPVLVSAGVHHIFYTVRCLDAASSS